MSTQIESQSDAGPSDAALLARAGSDPAAFARLYDRHWQSVWRFVYLRTGNRHAAEDVLHDVFLALIKAAPTFADRGVPIEHWLLRVGNRCCKRWMHKQRWRRRLGLLREEPANEPGLASPPEPGEVESALARLPDALREVVVLHYLHEIPVAVVADVVGCPEGTVKSRLSRARALLKSELRVGDEP